MFLFLLNLFNLIKLIVLILYFNFFINYVNRRILILDFNFLSIRLNIINLMSNIKK